MAGFCEDYSVEGGSVSFRGKSLLHGVSWSLLVAVKVNTVRERDELDKSVEN